MIVSMAVQIKLLALPEPYLRALMLGTEGIVSDRLMIDAWCFFSTTCSLMQKSSLGRPEILYLACRQMFTSLWGVSTVPGIGWQ